MTSERSAHSATSATDELEKPDGNSTASFMKELRKSSDGTNIIKEYKDMFGKDKADGSDRKDDKVAERGNAALALLKELVEEQRGAEKVEDRRRKWDFAASPHAQFGKTLDDTLGAFLAWARVKHDASKVNVSKALRRLEAYADWMYDAEKDLADLTPASVRKGVEAWAFWSSIDAQGRLVWWCDMGAVDVPRLKKDFTPEDHLRAFVWYTHAVMYNNHAQANGMVFVYNCAKMGMYESFTIMPAKLGTKLDKLTIGVLPVRLGCMYMFETPTWINIFMKILSVFMSKKMKERWVFLKNWDQVDRIGGLEAIPKGFGEGKVDGKLEGSVIEDSYFKD